MYTAIVLTGLATAAVAMPQPFIKRAEDSPLQLEITQAGNTGIKAVLTNSGDEDFNFLIQGSILDDFPLEKSQVFNGDEEIESQALWPIYEHPGPDDFTILTAGSSLELEWDIASHHDLSTGGKYTVSSSGFIRFAEMNSTEIAGEVDFQSNTIEISVNGDDAASRLQTFDFGDDEALDKRVSIQSDCSSSTRNHLINILNGCNSVANRAANEAQRGSSARMREFFKTDDGNTRNYVAQGFKRVAAECVNGGRGVRMHCSDFANNCRPGVTAYIGGERTALCPPFWRMPSNNQRCWADTQVNVVMHELTHVGRILGTRDYCYGQSCIRRLSASESRNNADTYQLFAQNAYSGC